MKQQVLYSYSYEGIECRNDVPMALTYTYDCGFVWRCHRSNCSVLFQSFFAERISPLRLQFLVIYLWFCCRIPRRSISLQLNANIDTIRGIINNFCQIFFLVAKMKRTLRFVCIRARIERNRIILKKGKYFFRRGERFRWPNYCSN